jgi:protein TonB
VSRSYRNGYSLEFAAAALSKARFFKMRPMTRNGVSVSSATIRIPIRFALPKD